MPSPGHEAYRQSVVDACRVHAQVPDFEEQLQRYQSEALVLWALDLEPARPVLEACYAPSPRGGDPRDPIVMLRLLLLALLVGQASINKWVPDLRASRVLRILAGLDPDESPPGVGTFYDFLHRLHDGPIRRSCEHAERPSELERRRAATARKLKRRPKGKGARKSSRSPNPSRSRKTRERRRKDAEAAQAESSPEFDPTTVTARLVAEINKAAEMDNPNDLLGRLAQILVDVAVLESGRRGLLGDLHQVVVGGDGSPLRTGANRHGKRVCGHGFSERCDCPRLYTDPDAQWGWDSHRGTWFFGHHFYEVSCSTSSHDLPLALWLDPGNGSDFTASLRTWTHLGKTLRSRADGWVLSHFIADAGHDAEPIHAHLVEQGVKPVIPLKTAAQATHPTRPDVRLSKRGVPLCEAGLEMAHWGSAGKGRTCFLCPLRGGKVERCPLAPEGQPDWHCRPDLKWGPVRNIAVGDNARLFPAVPRNTARYAELYNLRSGCERSNAVKKETFALERARHRRASFWLIRLHLIAVLQHARTWVADQDAGRLVEHLLGRAEFEADAA